MRLQRPRAGVVRLALLHPAEVLHHDRHAGERPGAGAGVRLLHRPLVARVDDRVDRRVAPLGGGDRRGDQFGGARLAAAHQLGLGGGVERGDVGGSPSAAP